MHICACIHNLAAGEAAVMRAADAGCERQAGLPKRLRTQPGTPKPLSGRRRARRGAEGPGARESGDSRQGSGQSNNQTAPAAAQQQSYKRNGYADKRNGCADPFLLVLFFIDFCCNFCVFNALFYMFFMRFFICLLYVFYMFLCVFRALSAPCGFIAFVSVRHFTYISTYQRVSGLSCCRCITHQRGRSFLANFSLPAI